MQNRFELVPGQRREKRVNVIIHHDISGQLIALTVEALDRRHHQAALAGVKLLPTSSEPPGNRIGDLVLPPVRKLSPVTNSMIYSRWHGRRGPRIVPFVAAWLLRAGYRQGRLSH